MDLFVSGIPADASVDALEVAIATHLHAEDISAFEVAGVVTNLRVRIHFKTVNGYRNGIVAIPNADVASTFTARHLPGRL